VGGGKNTKKFYLTVTRLLLVTTMKRLSTPSPDNNQVKRRTFQKPLSIERVGERGGKGEKQKGRGKKRSHLQPHKEIRRDTKMAERRRPWIVGRRVCGRKLVESEEKRGQKRGRR